MKSQIVVAITGSSGSIYAKILLEKLATMHLFLLDHPVSKQ